MLKIDKIAVVNSAVDLTPAGFDVDQEYEIILNPNVAPLYIGHDSSVTTSNGYPISAETRFQLKPNEKFYGISGTGSNIYVRVLAHTI